MKLFLLRLSDEASVASVPGLGQVLGTRIKVVHRRHKHSLNK